MPNTMHSLLLVGVVAGITILLRALPFLLFPSGRAIPSFLTQLSAVLPCAVMGMLVVYCLKGITPLAYPYGLPELLAAAVVVVLYRAKRSTLWSILAGTACYMCLLRFVF